MKKQLTYNDLYIINQDIMQMQKARPALALLLEPRIKHFYDRAGTDLAAMSGGMEKIKKKFIQTNEQGEFMTEGEGNNQDWKFVPVYTDFKTAAIIADRGRIKKMFEEEVKKFVSITITLDL